MINEERKIENTVKKIYIQNKNNEKYFKILKNQASSDINFRIYN